MIICTIVISGQLDYLQNKDLGYQKEQVVVVPTNKPRLKGMELAELYRNELLKQPQVVGSNCFPDEFFRDAMDQRWLQ
jgi:putative ABC transport system permease protein